jgi:dihydropteroate synthase
MINPLSTQIPFSINVKGKLLSLSKPIVMGVVNVTPDSFFKNSRVNDMCELCSRVQAMWDSGSAIVDIGAASSRPGAALVSSNDELKVLMPALQLLVKKFPEIPFSIDTYNAETARVCVGEGAAIINDDQFPRPWVVAERSLHRVDQVGGKFNFVVHRHHH